MPGWQHSLEPAARGNSRDKNLVSRKLWPHKEMPAEECGTGRGGKIHLILKEKVWGPGAHRLPPYMGWRGRGIFLFSPHSCSLVQGHCSLENSPTPTTTFILTWITLTALSWASYFKVSPPIPGQTKIHGHIQPAGVFVQTTS